ncbi:sodium-dependent lysophosphatidylcholine symporter 1 [Brachionus plicatilis]|uniref:Sodium-dependent lysophosphatidylcholine symporter 1 n=1 Tax=Brachionus plicatilis TaxID=10195 RepID=A0A3M7RZ43_BRAPC|nr:sodium-dependent lysophosphatidylcholine symporter 1 [Brachionus plicatilis]
MTKIKSSKKSDHQASYKIIDVELVIPSEAGKYLESSAKQIYSDQNEMKFYQRFFFGLAGLPFQVYFCAIGVFTTVYLLNKAGLPPEKTTYILFTSRIIDAITDPIYGYLVEKSRVTRFGKMKPWIAVSIPLSAISYGFRIPHTAMTMYLSHSLKERENLTILRMASEMVGLLVALGIQGPLVANDSACLKKNASGEIIPNQDSESYNNWEQFKYTYIAIIMTVIFLIGTIPLIIFVNEKPELINASAETQNVEERVSFWISLKRIFTFRPFIILLISTILSTSAIQIIQANFQLYFDYSYVAISEKFTITIFVLLKYSLT